MYAVEFEANVNNGIIEVPIHYKELNSKHVKIIALVSDNIDPSKIYNNNSSIYTDDFIKDNWKELLSEGFAQYDDNYYKSEQYIADRGAYLSEKNK